MKEYIKKRKAELEKLTEGFITDELQDEIYARQDELNRISRQVEPLVKSACKWILVNDRLPEVDVRVLVYVEDYHIDKDGTDTDRILFGYLRSSGKIKPDGCLGDFNVTKWMPIPKP